MSLLHLAALLYDVIFMKENVRDYAWPKGTPETHPSPWRLSRTPILSDGGY